MNVPISVRAGLRASWGGMAAALRSRAVRRAYVQLALVLVGLTLALDGAGTWAVLAWTDAAPDAAWWVRAGFITLRVLGVVVVFLAAPLVALVTVHVALPLLAERLFLAALADLDADRAEALARGPGLPALTSAAYSLRRLARYVALALLALLVGFVPLVGWLVAPPLQLLLSATALGGELLDPWLDLAGIRYADQRALLARHRSAIVAFAAPTMLLLLVPLVGPLVFGLAQAATAHLVVQVLDPEADAAMTEPRPGLS